MWTGLLNFEGSARPPEVGRCSQRAPASEKPDVFSRGGRRSLHQTGPYIPFDSPDFVFYIVYMIEGVYIGLDYGDRRTGVAKSDPTGLIASPLKTITATNIGETVKQVLSIIEQYQPIGIVIGYPISLSGGSAGERCRVIDSFIALLQKKYSGPIYKEDERFSSAEAERVIHMHDQKSGKSKGRIDRMAAAIILQTFLDRSREKDRSEI